MSGMFTRNKTFNQDIGNWDVSQVESIRKIFYQNTGFNKNLSNWCLESLDDADDAFVSSNLSVENRPPLSCTP